MAEGPPPSPPGAGELRPRPVRQAATRATRSPSTPALISVALLVVAGTSGTVLLARDAGGPSDTGAPRAALASPSASATPSPSRASPPAPSPTPAAAPAPPTPTPRPNTQQGPGAPTAPPAPAGTTPPLPTYSGPTPEALLSGPTPAPAPAASRVTPDKLSFSFTPSLKTSSSQSVVVVNDGSQPLHVFPTGISGDQAGDFRIVSDSCSGATVEPQQECVVSIVYSPRTAGSSTAALLVSDDSGGSPDGRPTKTSSVPLSGSAG